MECGSASRASHSKRPPPTSRAARPARSAIGAVRTRAGLTAAVLVCTLLALVGCAAPEKPVEDPLARAQALIDAGNTAYRSGDFRLAARRYGAAVVVRKDDPAAYYGLGMALAKLGRDEEARVAYARARDLAQKAAPVP